MEGSLLALATAWRVGELHVVSSVVSSSGGDLFLSFLPEFRAMSDSEALLFLILFGFVLLPTLLVTFQVNSFSVRCRVFGLFSTVLPLFLLVIVLSSFLLALILVLCLRTLLASLFGVSLLIPILRLAFLSVWFLCLLPLRLPHLLVIVLPFVVMGLGVSRRHGLSIVTLLCLLSWRPLPGLLPLSLLLSISLDVQFSSSQGFSLGPVLAAGSVV